MFIINTDQGYIGNGELHNGLQFTLYKENAQTFTQVEEEMINDLHTYYCCEEIKIENISK